MAEIRSPLRRGWLLLLCAIAFFAGARAAEQLASFDSPYLLWAGATLLVALALPAFSVVLELSLFPLLYLALEGSPPLPESTLNLPLVALTLTVLAHPLQSRLAWLFALAGALLWADLPTLLSAPPDAPAAWALLAAGVLAAALPPLATGRPGPAPTSIDLVVNSYSGNTAHLAQAFGDAATEAGARVTVHRFHHHKSFAPELGGDALVLAYPIAGWQPFWPMLEYLLFKLPRGGGKPAFILSSSGGGPENSHVVPWLTLWLKGYRVLGRLGAVYPINVTIFRLGSSRLWRLLDAFLPRQSDLRRTRDAARAFCQGRRGGLGLTLFPFVLFILGPLTYNRFINYIYRSYSYKRLCTDCGLCIRFCPTERLYMKNGRVRSKGTCALCYGCVNLCPTDAAQLFPLSELGNVYTPRWPKLIVKRKPAEVTRPSP